MGGGEDSLQLQNGKSGWDTYKIYNFNIGLSHYIVKQLHNISNSSRVVKLAYKRRSRVIRVAWLWFRKSPDGYEFEAGLRNAMTGKLFLPTQQ